MKLAAKRLLILWAVLACLAAAALGWCVKTETRIVTGRYLQAKNGSHMVIDSRGSPIVMGDRSGGGAIFRGLSDGDQVLVVCSGINAIYPAQSGAYWCLRLGEGSAADLPDDTLLQLAELGWISLPV